MSLESRGAVITGGGRGIGAAIARALSGAGASVILAARSADQIEALADKLRERGAKAWAVLCDISDPESVDGLMAEANDRLEAVDILVNNAGIAHSAPVHKLSLEDWQRLLAVNATGTFLCTRAILSGMTSRGWGRVVNISSVAGLTGSRYIAGYAASKHAVIGFTRSVADEVAASGVTVNAVCPGFVETEMTDRSIENIVSKTGMSREDALNAILATTPQRRLITPDEVAGTVLWLCGEEARGVNGQAIVMDGGGMRA